MKSCLKTLAPIALAAILGASTTLAGVAQEFPSKPITLIVPFAAGGPTDTVGRLIGEAMSADLGQQVLVQNVGGAGGTLGAGQTAAAPADGYTILLAHIGMATAPTLYRNLEYDPLTAFSPVGLVTEVPMTLVARNDLEPSTYEELVAYITANGDQVTYAHAGIGSASHLCGMLFMESIGVQMTTVPYQGAAPAMTDIIGKQVDVLCDQTTNTTAQIQAGEVKAYAVTTPERLATLPDLPTTAELKVPDFQVSAWHGIWAPANTPEDVVAQLQASLQVALKDQKVIDRFAELGTTPVADDLVTPDALNTRLAEQIDLWRPIIEAAGAFAD